MLSKITRCILVYLICSPTLAFANPQTKSKIDSIYTISLVLQFTHFDSALINFQKCLEYYEAEKDTVKVIETKKLLVKRYSGTGKYLEAYDIAWSILPLVNNVKYINDKISVYRSIASLYLIFEQYDNSTKYYNIALDLTHKYVIEEADKNDLLGSLYDFEAWLVREKSNDLKRSEELVLKSLANFKKIKNNPYGVYYSNLHLADLYIVLNRTEEASTILHALEDEFQAAPRPIHSLLYHHLGNLYLKKNEIPKAIQYFEKSIVAIDQFQNHLDKKVEILETLSECYAKRNELNKAFNSIKQAKTLGDSLFGSQSSQNRVLFEIKNKYEAQLQENKEEIKSQKLTILEREKELWVLRSIIYSVCFILIIIGIFAFFKVQARRQKAEQALQAKKQKLEKEKQEELIEIKNKEIMSSALQLMERDQSMDLIKKQLDDLRNAEDKSEIINQIQNSIKVSKSKNWEEFEVYFTNINNKFYTILRTKHPKLTPTDIKICAFIKMGFSSKDMAQIMSIGFEGLNTTRSRLRKKMGLERSVNMLEYLQKIHIQ